MYYKLTLALTRKMKYTISLIILTLLIGCSNNNNNNNNNNKNNNCDNRFDFISVKDTIPILNFDIKTPYYLTRNDISNLYYNGDLCEHCAQVEFKIPFDIENKNGFLKIMADFDTPYCQECPIPNKFREYYHINMDKENQILIEYQISSIDSLQSNIEKYLKEIDENEIRSKPYSRVNYLIRWHQGANQIFLDTILTKIYKAHLNSIEKKVRKSGRDFCLLSKKELIDLKRKYPMRIEFDLGKSEKEWESIYRNFNTRVKDISL